MTTHCRLPSASDHRPLHQLDRRLRLSTLQRQHPEHVQRLGMVGPCGKHLAVQRLGPAQIAALVELLRLAHQLIDVHGAGNRADAILAELWGAGADIFPLVPPPGLERDLLQSRRFAREEHLLLNAREQQLLELVKV